MTNTSGSGGRKRRCPACGEPVHAPIPEACSLCGFRFSDASVTSADFTPYAKSYVDGERAYLRMVAWVWRAGGARLRHLALVQSSAASKHFATVHLVWLTIVLFLLELTRSGWHRISGSSRGPFEPSSEGWFRLAGMERPFPTGVPLSRTADLWWSPAQALVAGVVSLLLAPLVLLLLHKLIRVALSISYPVRYRDEFRMSAGLHYATAWFLPAILGGVLVVLRPWTSYGSAQPAGPVVAEATIAILAATPAIVGFFGWWFSLVRMGSAAPQRCRSRVVTALGVFAPLIVCGGCLAWWFGLPQLLNLIYEALRIQF